MLFCNFFVGFTVKNETILGPMWRVFLGSTYRKMSSCPLEWQRQDASIWQVLFRVIDLACTDISAAGCLKCCPLPRLCNDGNYITALFREIRLWWVQCTASHHQVYCNYVFICGINWLLVCLQASTHCLRTRRIFSRSSGASLAVPTWIRRSRKVAIWTLISQMTCN